MVNTATVHTSGLTNGLQTEVLNYGMYSLQNDTGTQFNIIDWRIADWRGFLDNPANLPPDPADPLRTYLPNGYTGGAPPLTNLTAPGEPVLMASYAYVSGANPPAALAVTRLVVQVELTNSSPAAIHFNAANDQIVSALPAAGASNLGNVRCFSGTFGNTVGTAVNGGTFARCNFSGANFTLASGSSVILSYQFDLTPPAAGTHFVTRVPANPASGTYNNGGLGPEHHHLGPVLALPGRHHQAGDPGAHLRPARGDGHRGDPGHPGRLARGPVGRGRVRDPGPAPDRRLQPLRDPRPVGRGPRTLLTPEPVKAVVPDSLGPLVYRARTGPVAAPYVLVEEIETTGRKRLMGPFKVGDPRLRASFERGAAVAEAQASRARRPERGPADRGPRAALAPPHREPRREGRGGCARPRDPSPGRPARGGSARPHPAHGAAGDEPGRRRRLRSRHGWGRAGRGHRLRQPRARHPLHRDQRLHRERGDRPRPRLFAELTRFDPAAPAGTLRVERDRFYAPGAP